MPFLQFKGRSAVETYHYSLPHHVLKLDAERSVLGADESASLDGNLIIEGDNLLALKALLPTHTGRIKCIYIDPPYNTGEEGWVYNDNLTHPQFKEWVGETVGKEGEDACRHDKWCCMMYPRLHLLMQLLSEDGIIFISLDDNEAHSLRYLMDELFGSEHFIGCFVWESRLNKDNRNVTGVSVAHEYVICYGKKVRGELRDLSQYTNPDNDPHGAWTSGNMVGLLSEERRPNLHYPLTNPETGIVYKKPEMGWRYDSNTMKRLIAEKRILWPAQENGRPRRKVFLDELKDAYTGFSSLVGDDVYTKDGTQEIERIFGRRVMDFPKPSALIKQLLEQGTDSETIVLDSFAGSGTTAQAVLELNNEDGGNRKFILIQQPFEPKKFETEQINICETITAERVKRVIGGYAYTGTQTETLLEEKVGLNTLKKSGSLLERIEAAKEQGKAEYDKVQSEMKDGVVRVLGVRNVTEKTEGLGGSFTYVSVSDTPLLGDYRDLGEVPPPYEELAKYIFYTETSREWDAAEMNRATGKIGERGGVSYYLLYKDSPTEDWGMDTAFLKKVAVNDPNRQLVVYHEKFVMHREQLREWEKATGKRVRTMQVPFHLR